MGSEEPRPLQGAVALFLQAVVSASSPDEATAMFNAIPETHQAAEVLLALPDAQGRNLFLHARREGLQAAVLESATSERKEAFFTLLEPTQRLEVMTRLPGTIKTVLMQWLGLPRQQNHAQRGENEGEALNRPSRPTTPRPSNGLDDQQTAETSQSAIRKSWLEAEAKRKESSLRDLDPDQLSTPERSPTPSPLAPPAATTSQSPISATPAPRGPPPPPKSHEELAATWDRISKRRAELHLPDAELEDGLNVIREDEEWEDEFGDDPEADEALFKTLPIESAEEFAQNEKNWKPTEEEPHRPFTWRWAEMKMPNIEETKWQDPMGAWGYAQHWQYALRIRKFGVDGLLKMYADLEAKFAALPQEYKDAVGPPRGRGDCKMDYHARLFWAVHMPTYHNIKGSALKGEFADRTLALFYENYPDYSPFCARRRVDQLGEDKLRDYKKKMKGYQTSAISHSPVLGGKNGGLLKAAVQRDAADWLVQKLRKTSKEVHWGKSEQGDKIVGPMHEAELAAWVKANEGKPTKGVSLGLLHHIRSREFKKQPPSVQKQYEAIARTLPEYDPDNLAAVNDTALVVIDQVLESVAAKTQWRSLFCCIAETSAGPKYMLGEYGPERDTAPSFIYHDADGKNLIGAFRQHVARIAGKDFATWEETPMKDLSAVAEGSAAVNLATRGAYRDCSYPPPVFPTKATHTQRCKILGTWLLGGIVKFQGGDPEWKPVARNNCTYFDVMTIPPDQNGKPGPMTITETSWMSPENVDKLIEHIHASHFDEEMDDDKRFTFMGQRCHEEPPVVEGVLPVAKVVSTKAKAKAPKRKDPAAKTPPPKPSGKPAKRKATAAPSPSPPIEKRQLRRRAAKRIDRGQEPATPEPEDGAERDEESDEGGSPFKPLEGDGEEEDELDDDDIPLSELHDLERGAGAGDDDEQDQTSKAPVDKGKGRAERTPSEEPDLEHPGADDDPPEEDEHPESTEVAATLLPRLKIFRLTHKSIKMGAKAKPWVEDFDRSLLVDQARNWVVQVHQDNANLEVDILKTHDVPLPKILCAAMIINYIKAAVGVPFVSPEIQYVWPEEEVVRCEPLKWEPEDFAPEPMKGNIKSIVAQILDPAGPVPTASDVLNRTLEGHIGVFNVLHCCIHRALLKLVRLLRQEQYMQYPTLDLVGAARATLYLQRSGRILDCFAPLPTAPHGWFESMGLSVASVLSESMATICIVRYMATVMVPVVVEYRKGNSATKKMWSAIHGVLEWVIVGIMVQSEAMMQNMFTTSAFDDVEGLKMVAEALLHDPPWWSTEFPQAPTPFVLSTRVDLIHSGITEFLTRVTLESWAKMSSIDRALLALMACFTGIQLEQDATVPSGDKDLVEAMLVAATKVLDDVLEVGAHLIPPKSDRTPLRIFDVDTIPFADWTTGRRIEVVREHQPPQNEDTIMANGEAGAAGGAGGPSAGGGSVPTQAPEPGPSAPESSRPVRERAQSVLGRRSRDDISLGLQDGEPEPKRRAGSTPVQRDLYRMASAWQARPLLPPVAEEELASSRISTFNPVAAGTSLPQPRIAAAPQTPPNPPPGPSLTGDPLPAATPNSQAEEQRRRSARGKVKPADPVPRTVAERREGQQG